jgi:glucokinase
MLDQQLVDARAAAQRAPIDSVTAAQHAHA